jgi:hypothetical protein
VEEWASDKEESRAWIFETEASKSSKILFFFLRSSKYSVGESSLV